MKPRIRYATSRDGVKIAFWAMGSGYPIVLSPSPTASHLEKEWAGPELRAWFESLARDFTVVRFDGRGLGLSDHEVADLSQEAAVQDLDAVVSTLGLRTFALFAGAAAAPAAIEYSTHNPAATHLVLWHAVARGRDFYESQERRSLQALARADWEMFSLTAASAYRGWNVRDNPRAVASVLEAAGPDYYFRMLEAQQRYDAKKFLPAVRAKTLVLHRRDYNGVDISNSRYLASHIPNARMEILDGSSGMYYRDEEVVEVIRSFLAEDASATWLVSVSEIENQTLVGKVTSREAQVLRLVASGLGNSEVAMRLGISVHTVERHLANVYEKWGVHSRVELILHLLHHSQAVGQEAKQASA